jgi:hypothetical protein
MKEKKESKAKVEEPEPPPAPARITYTCLGPEHALDPQEYEEALDYLQKKLDPEIYEKMGDPDLFWTIGPVQFKGKLRLFHHRPEGSGGDSYREYCGVDITELIEAVPVDGDTHEVICLRCGTVNICTKTLPAEEVDEE